MKQLFRRELLLFVIPLILNCKDQGDNKFKVLTLEDKIDSIQMELKKIEQLNTLSGFAVSVFTKDTILFQKGYGYSDLSTQKPFTTDNVQIIASVTKTLVGVSLMKLVERGELSLDTPINDILPYKIVNPHFPEEVITLRHLATHTSTITGTKKSDKGYRFETPLKLENFSKEHRETYKKLIDVYNQTESLSMKEFLYRKLSNDGVWYEKAIFQKAKPGTRYHYSNLGIALLAHCIEITTGQSFRDFSSKNILEPLAMNQSTWSLSEVDPNQHVSYYYEIDKELPKYHIITYPDGGLYSSVTDMTKYLQEIMRSHDGKGSLLKSKSTQEMIRKQFEGEGLTEGICWDLSFEGLAGHPGNDFGTSTLMYFNPTTGIGRILFTNTSTENEAQEDAFYSIFNALFQYDLTNK